MVDKNNTEKNYWAFLKKLPGIRENLLFFTIAIIGFGTDLYTKSIVFKYVTFHGNITIIKNFFRFVAVTNDGAAFNLFAGRVFFLALISFFALAIIIAIFLFGGSKSILFNISLGFLTGGICGNLYDRLFNDGLVRDFIDVVIWPGKHWPAFNVADSMLCIGVALMLIASFVTEQPCQKHGRQQRSEPQ